MTMTSSERGLPFPLKRGEVRPASLEGTRSAEKSIERGTGGDRESLSIDAVRDYSVEVRFLYSLYPFMSTLCTRVDSRETKFENKKRLTSPYPSTSSSPLPLPLSSLRAQARLDEHLHCSLVMQNTMISVRIRTRTRMRMISTKATPPSSRYTPSGECHTHPPVLFWLMP